MCSMCSMWSITGTQEVAVVVCTRNRSAALVRACEAILGVDYDPTRWEMVIVDNASTDDTAEVARSVAAAHPGRVRVVVEEEIGLSAARNAGIRETSAELIAFIDDDAFPNPEWLAAVVVGFVQPEVMCVGGPVDPLIEGELPSWFQELFLPYLAAWDPGPKPIELHYIEYPRGANVTYRRSGLSLVGGFSTHLGRKGTSLLSCEETELCLRLERAGYTIRYQPGARVRHVTPVDRMTPGWMEARFAAQGRSETILNWMHGGLEAVRIGLRAARRRARAAARDRAEVGQVFADCQRAWVRGYLRGLFDILRVPRYRPPTCGLDLAPWRPFE